MMDGSRARFGSVICVHCSTVATSGAALSRLAPDRWGARLGSGRLRLISLNRLPLVTLTLLPAVDVAHRRAVRLVQGNADTETSYRDPLDAALVDKDGCGAQR